MRPVLALAALALVALPAHALPLPALPVTGCQAVAPQNACFFACTGPGTLIVLSMGSADQSAKALCGDGPASQAGCGAPFLCADVGHYAGPAAPGACYADEATSFYACTFVPA
ncbi:MAG TPA: hypothetical protein VGR28_06040 [Candidatus Thermoplasmatota archaeon]|jgi:hypothetical protein|nr:hypothetical protein [Candidatus Thermoplasmatota archaeon]